MPLICFSTFLVFQISLVPLLWRGVRVCQRPFVYLVTWSCGFCLSFCLSSRLYFFIYIGEPFMHLWDEAYLIMVFLVCKYFIKHCCMYIHKGNWFVIILYWVFMWFRYQGNCGLIKWTVKCSFCFYFGESFEEWWYYLFFKSLIEF